MTLPSRTISVLRNFLTSEMAGGVLLVATAVAAMLIANSPFAPGYFNALSAKVAGLSVLHWVNDGLMAVFFFLVGLEIKRELLDGQLKNWSQRILPGAAALGGMLVPGIVYSLINAGSPDSLRGWAIPAATDIAFSLAVLGLLASRVPVSLKVFLTALAVLDDFGAVVIIAIFFTANVSPVMLSLAGATVLVLFALNAFGVKRLLPYLLTGALLWFFTLKSGVHATVAGVALAIFIPIAASPGKPDSPASPLHVLENALHVPVAYFILPIFALANAGVPLAGIQWDALTHPVTLGVGLGLFLGKQLGVFGATWLAIALGFARRPKGANWLHLYGVALLCGIGFTMSLFIGALALEGDNLRRAVKIGVLLGSIASAGLGWLVLRWASTENNPNRT